MLKPKEHWSKTKVIQKIKEFNRQGVDLRAGVLQNSDNPELRKLQQAGYRFYGSWKTAVARAGISYKTIEDKFKYNKKAILEQIIEWNNQGKDIRLCYVQKVNKPFYRRACKAFGNWRTTIKKTKIKENNYLINLKEQKKLTLLEQIKEAYDNGVALDSGSIRNSEYKFLYWSSKGFYKGKTFWENTLNDAGIDSLTVVKQQKWTKEKVKLHLKKRFKDKKPMNITSIINDPEEKGLCKAIYNHFDCYTGALEYSKIRIGDPRIVSKPYTEEEVIQRIITYDIQGTNFNGGWIVSDKNPDQKLKKIFWWSTKRKDGWRTLLRKAGVNPEEYINYRNFWNKTQIKKHILKISESGEDLNTTNILKLNHGLYSAALRSFGSWEKAIEFVGLKYSDVRLGLHLSKEEIVEHIKSLSKKGSELNAAFMLEEGSYFMRNLYLHATKKFDGGWDTALKWAGLDPENIRLHRKKYTLSELTDIILELEEKGVSLKQEDLRKDSENAKYFFAASKNFGGWRNFLDNIGIDSSKYVRGTNWENGEKVLSTLKERFPSGFVTSEARKNDPNLYAAAFNYFGGIKAAAFEAGLVYSKKGLDAWRDKDAVLECLKEMFPTGVVHKINEKNHRLTLAIGKYFGTTQEACLKANLIYARRGRVSEDILKSNPNSFRILYNCNKEFLDGIANRVFFGAVTKGMVSLPREDLVSEAYILFCDLAKKKPADVDIRRFSYKSIYYSLINMNKEHAKQIPIGDDSMFDFL